MRLEVLEKALHGVGPQIESVNFLKFLVMESQLQIEPQLIKQGRLLDIL